jgi:1,5-anhydro-D-fructose reductase (1,5-anhydro-D-mannitol-forming)
MTVLRWGLIGCGDISERRVAPALRAAPGSALVAVARAQADRAAEFAARHGADRSFADWRELVRDDDS